MVVTAVNPIKFKRRKVSAIRDFPKDCGRKAQPPAAASNHRPDVPNGVSPPPPPAVAVTEILVSPAQVWEPPLLGSPKGPKPEPLELVTKVVEEGMGAPALEANGAVTAAEEGLPVLPVKVEPPEISTGGSDQLELVKESMEQPELPKGGSDQPELMKESSDQMELAKECLDQRELLKGGSDRLELSNGGLDQPELPNGAADQQELPNGAADQQELPNGAADQQESPNGAADQLELPKESSDKTDLGKGGLGQSKQLTGASYHLYSKRYPPPKRRKLSATRDFPVGCGRTASFVLRKGSLEVAASAPSLKSKSFDAEKEHAVVHQLAAEDTIEGNIEVKHTERDKTKVKNVEATQTRDVLQENDDEVRVKVPSASLRNKSSDGEKKKLAVKQPTHTEGSIRALSTEKSQDVVRRNDVKQIREIAQEFSSEARVKSASKSSRDENIVDEHRNKKILVRSGSEKKLDGHDAKQDGKSLLVKETRESKPSPDSRPQLAHKSSVTTGSSMVRKLLIKGPVRHPTDARVVKRKFTEEAENIERFTDDQTEGDGALETYGDRIIVQALMAAPNCPWRQGRKSGGMTNRSVTPKTMKKEGKSWPKNSAFMGASVSRVKNEVASEDEEDSVPLDEENDKALTVYNKLEENEKVLTIYRKPQEWTVTALPLVPPKPNHKGSDNADVSDRLKVKRALRMFQLLARKFLQGEESKSKDLGRMKRVDLNAARILKEKNEWVNTGKPILGHVPGVEVGDEFHYRVELSIVGLHRPFQGGIDSMKKDGTTLATSIVASGGYQDDVDNSDILIYSGSGGNPAGGDKQAGDQKLERGNLALKNSIDASTPVRVIRGSKELKESDHDARAKTVTTFTYDGLYVVENYWTEKGPHGFSVFKFQLRRMAGQPELAAKEVKRSKKAKIREGLCSKDISEGKENMPICAVNIIDDDQPMPFKYITENMYPSWYVNTPPSGCNCTDGCSDSEKCACAVKNGGEIPFNYNGAIVQAKPLVYECGPSCKCRSSCLNRVSQHGIRVPLEIFKTKSRGWGVRSLYSIPSGSFICEYVGELLKDSDAELRSNDEYLFDIGHNYEDKTLWEGLPSLIPGLQSSSICETVEDVGFTIDAAEYGNIGRFINHSCSPNIYAQNVLYDHDDKRMPHIMFFAADNIPPLQELTYHYNYTVDQVRDSEGNIKRKNCYCGAPECTGRLY